MSRNQYQRAFLFNIMWGKQFKLMIIDNNLFIDWFENLMKEPSHRSEEWHFIVRNHLFDDSLSFLVDLVDYIHRGTLFFRSLFDHLRNRLLHCRRVKNQRFILLIWSRLEKFPCRSCPIDIWEIRSLVNWVASTMEDIILVRNWKIDILVKDEFLHAPVEYE